MPVFDFGIANFDAASGVVMTATGRETTLRPQSARVLAELAKTPGDAVSKAALVDAVWGDLAVTDGSLTQCIADIRRALNDKQRRIIQTMPKFGYRLVPSLAKELPGDDGVIVPLQQAPIRFARSGDGVHLAWTESGAGLPILKAPSWISNIEMEAQSLIFAEFYRWFSQRAHLIRFDQRGTSLSDSVEGPLSISDMVEDMRAVADAAGLDRFFLYGPSQGVAFSIAFAHRYPERVLGIIGRGGFGRGWLTSGDEGELRKVEGSKALIRAGWDDDNPECRRFFTARLIPDCGSAVAREFDEMQRRACNASAVLANLDLMVGINVEEMAREVDTPTLLLHSRGDRSVAVAEGRRLATTMPNAEFVILDDENHIFLPDTLGFKQATEAIDHFFYAFDRHSDASGPDK